MDALEDLIAQRFPEEPISTERFETLQRSTDGVRDPIIRKELAVVYAVES